MERGYELAGRLLDERGGPVGNRRLRLLVLERSSFDPSWEQRLTASRVQGEGLSGEASESKNHVIIQAQYTVPTDQGGRFALTVCRRGEAFLMYWDPEYCFKIEEVGNSRESRKDIRFTVTTAPPQRRLTIRDGGALLSNTGVLLMNYSHWPLEVAVSLETDGNGEIEVGNLPHGEWFGIKRARTAEEPRVFQLGSDREVDLARLRGAVQFMNER